MACLSKSQLNFLIEAAFMSFTMKHYLLCLVLVLLAAACTANETIPTFPNFSDNFSEDGIMDNRTIPPFPSNANGSNGSGEGPFLNESNETNGSMEVRLSNFEFLPSEITVQAGQEVTFVNEVGFHSITIVELGIDESLSPGEVTSISFDEAGEYEVYCRFHEDEGMMATIIVE